MYNIPDRLIVRYEGGTIFDTGFVSGSQIGTFQIPKGDANELDIVLATNDEGTLWNYKIDAEPREFACLLFREHKESRSWGLPDDNIPGFDHTALYVNGNLYESHPGYTRGQYYDTNTEESITVDNQNGVQNVHSLASFLHDSSDPSPTQSTVSDVKCIEIPIELAKQMEVAIQSQIGAGFNDVGGADIIAQLGPDVQKGGDSDGDGNPDYTCVGLIEWAAEQAGHNNGQGFIPNEIEIFEAGGRELPTLSPELLLNHVDGSNFPQTEFLIEVGYPTIIKSEVKESIQRGVEGVSNLIENGVEWARGLADPVDFIVTDPLGRQFGHTAATGTLNEIPSALYSGNGDLEEFLLLDPVPGEYRVQLVGLDSEVMFGFGGSNFEGVFFDGYLAKDEIRELTFEVPGDENEVVDLRLTRVDSEEKVFYGEQLEYSLKIENVGTSTATNVRVIESAPESISASSTSSRVVDEIAPGEVVRFEYNGVARNAGVNLGEMLVVADQVDLNIVNNFLAYGVKVEPANPEPADVSLEVVLSGAPPLELGDEFSVEVEILNAGPGVATGLMVDVSTPDGVNLVDSNVEQGNFDTQNTMWDVGNLRDGVARKLTLDFEIERAVSGAIEAELIAVNEPDPDSAPNNGSRSEDDFAAAGLEVGDFVPEPPTDALPLLTEKEALGDEAIAGAPLFFVGPSGDAEIIFVDEYAGFQSSLGVYLVGPDGTIGATEWAFERIEHSELSTLASENARPGGGPLSPGETVSLSDLFALEDLQPGTGFGLFLVADGAAENPFTVYDGGTLGFRSNSGPATITDATPDLVHIAENGKETLIVGDILHTIDAGSPDPLSNTLNPGGTGQVTSGLLGGEFTVAFEDKPLNEGSDRDFNDALFVVETSEGEQAPVASTQTANVVASLEQLVIMDEAVTV